MKKKYKIVGALNMFNIVPDSNYTVYQDEEGKLYGGFVKNVETDGPHMTYFMPWREDVLDKIVFFDQIKDDPDANVFFDDTKDSYEYGDTVVYVHQYGPKDYYIGEIDKYLEFIKHYKESVERVLNSGNEENIKRLIDSYGPKFGDLNIYLDILRKDIIYDENLVSKMHK